MSSEDRKPTRTRRRRRFGSICKRPEGGLYLRIAAPPSADGKRRFLVRSIATREEGEQALRELEKARLLGINGPPAPPAPPKASTLTVGGAIRQYIDSRGDTGMAASTLRRYEGNLKIIAQSSLAGRAVAALTPTDIESYIAWRKPRRWQTLRQGDAHLTVLKRGARASNASVNRDLILLKAALSRLVKLGEIRVNPLSGIEMLREPKAPRVALSKSEIKAILGCAGPWLRPFVLAATYTGARSGELARLTWGDINFDRSEINLWRPKTQNASAIHMHPVIEAELRVLKKSRAGILKRPPRDTDPVFTTRWGNRMKYHQVAWRGTIRRAGLADRGICFHTLRHSFATHFLEGGAAISDLKEILGHASVSTTEIYAKGISARAKASIAAMDFGG